MTHLFIINPAAGSHDRTETYSQQIRETMERHGIRDYRIAVSEGPGDCRRLARVLAQSGHPCRIYACGGDGTLNEVASGAAGCPNAAVTVFSGGSGNDFVRLFDEPKAFFDLDRLLDAEETEFDMIRCNDRYAINISSVGLDARIGTDAANYKRLPFLQGFWAYAASTVVNTIKGVAEHYVVKVNGRTLDGDQTLVCVCNGRFYGGGFNPVPQADPADGLLDVLVVKKVSRLLVAQVVGKYKDGKYADYPQYIEHLRTRSIEILCDRQTPVNLDGELLLTDRVTMEIAPEKLRFFYPRGLTWSRPEERAAAGV